MAEGYNYVNIQVRLIDLAEKIVDQENKTGKLPPAEPDDRIKERIRLFGIAYQGLLKATERE